MDEQYAKFLFVRSVVAVEMAFVLIPLFLGAAKVFGVRIESLRRQRARFEFRTERPAFSLLLMAFAGAALSFGSILRDSIYRRKAPRVEGSGFLKTVRSVQRPDRVVIWLHGTWKKATFNAHRPLLRMIEERYPDAEIVEFEWSSPNIHFDRKRAADELVALIRRDSKYAGLPLRLIGHSHGGTVAAFAATSLVRDFDVRIITLATPFTNLALWNVGSRARSKAYASATSAQVLLYFPAQVFGLLVAAFFWYTNISLPPIVALTDTFGSKVITALFAGAFSGLMCARLFSPWFAVRVKRADEHAIALAQETTIPHGSAILRAWDDPLLNAMQAAGRVYEQRLRAGLLVRKFSDEAFGGSMTSQLIDFIIKTALLVGYLKSMKLLYVWMIVAVMNAMPGASFSLIGLACAFVLVSPPIALSWIFPLRIVASLGAYIARYVIAIWPTSLVLTIGQARLAGLPSLVLFSGFIRIGDAPEGYRSEIVGGTGTAFDAPLVERHTAMLKEPELMNQVMRYL